MKTLLSTLALAALLLAGAGCANPNLAAFRITAGAIVTADQGMNAFEDAYVAHQVSEEQQDAVHAAYERYRAAIQVERDAVTAWNSGDATTSPASASAAVSAASSDVLALVFQFLPADRVAKLKAAAASPPTK